MTTNKNGEEQKRRQAIAQQLAAEIKASGLKQAEVARRIAEILGRPVGRYIVNKMTTGARAASQEELGAIARVLRYGESRPMEDPREENLSAGHDGDRDTARFDVDRLRRTLISALLAPDMDLPQARQVAEGWLESLRILPPVEQSEDDNIG